MTANETRLHRLFVRLLDVSLAAHKVGDMDRKAKALKVQKHVGRRLQAIALANPAVLSVRQRWGGKKGHWRR